MSLVEEPPVTDGGSSRPGGPLFNAMPPDRLSLSTAFEVAFKVLARPTLMVPLLGVSVAVNAFLEAFVLPGLLDAVRYSPTGPPVVEDIQGLLVLFAVTFVVGIVGSLVIAMYGQIWAVAASVGPYPSIDDTFELAARRWLRFLGASFVATLITLGTVLVFLAPAFLLIRDSAALAVLMMLGLLVPYAWIFARISMITWLAADGLPVGESIRGSWRITHGGVLRILGWSLATGLVIALISFGIGAVLGRLPLVGSGIAQGIQLAMTYGAGVTLYRRTQAAAAPPVAQAAAPPAVPGAPLG